MQRLFTSLISALLVAMLAVPASAASGAAGAGAPSMSGMTMQHTCPAGQKWVKGYKKKGGAQVKGYCRSSKAAPATTMPVKTK
jgi:hypothetical protein